MTGKQLYSKRLGDWHLWLTLVGGYGMVVLWLAQGLTGAPRRWAVLPDVYDPATVATLPFILMIALGAVIFAWNLIQTARGCLRDNDELTLVRDEWQLALAVGVVVCFALPLFAVGLDRDRAPVAGPGATAGGSGPDGAILFAGTCGGCHVLSAASTSGTLGPNLDQLGPTSARVLKAIRVGGRGTGKMPPELLSGPDAEAVAAYVQQVTGSGR
jgi:mono/diheme cytochrome c family protein